MAQTEKAMSQNILDQIQIIDEAIAWVKENKPGDFNLKFLELVEERRKLKILLEAEENNPGVAAFGESQVGKSYLMSCFLQKGDGSPFMVKGNGQLHNFVFEINPPGEGKEATGVVTRFTSFDKHPERYAAQYPVLAKCFTVADLLLILSDTYFNDFNDYTSHSESEIKELSARLVEQYTTYPVLQHPALTADDIFGMKRYFGKHINNAQAFRRTSFFDEVALVIDRVPVEDYANLFQIFWNNNPYLTRLFERLLNTLKKLNFEKYVYMPIEAVLHHRIEEDTLMSVKCLRQLLRTDHPYQTEVYLREGDRFDCAGVFTKSEIGALCSEVVYKIDEDFLNSSGCYQTEKMTDYVKTQVDHERVEMSMLRHNDLLDFPGARSRLTQSVADLVKGDIILEAFLRGKVAYLFNKYNEALAINVLLYCHHDIQTNVTNLWQLLNDWVNTYVGDTPEKRRERLRGTDISPLFYIATKFNIDMKYNGVNVSANGRTALEQRWTARFETVLLDQCVRYNNESVQWVKNWDAPGSFFKNSYLLRDFKFSGPDYSQLYEGFETAGEERKMLLSDDYYQNLRDTFVNHPVVRKLFERPEVSWDMAATQGNDGALYIIDQLSKVAAKMSVLRDHLFEDVMNTVSAQVKKIIQDYHFSDKEEVVLEANIRKAKNIFREMDFTCNLDQYYFGHLIQALQMTEPDCYQLVHATLQNMVFAPVREKNDTYEMIRATCRKYDQPLNACKTVADAVAVIQSVYDLDSIEEAEDFLKRKGVEPKNLITGDFRRKRNSYVIADEVFETWCGRLKSVDFMNEVIADSGFDQQVMSNLLDNLVQKARLYKVSDRMAACIAEYVNVINLQNVNESLLADMLANVINDFVLDLGYGSLTASEIENVRKQAVSRHIPLFKYIDKELPAVYDETALTALFDEMVTSPKALIPSFEDHYNQWIEYMFISLMAHCDVPDYDHQANQVLGEILNKL